MAKSHIVLLYLLTQSRKKLDEISEEDDSFDDGSSLVIALEFQRVSLVVHISLFKKKNCFKTIILMMNNFSYHQILSYCKWFVFSTKSVDRIDCIHYILPIIFISRPTTLCLAKIKNPSSKRKRVL